MKLDKVLCFVFVCFFGIEHLSGQRAQLDHVIINAKWLNSLRNCRAYGSVELDSDHRIVSATVKSSLRIQAANPVKCKQCDWKKLEPVPIKKGVPTRTDHICILSIGLELACNGD